MSLGLGIRSVQPRNWRPGFAPQSVGLRGGWSPAPLPHGPDEIERTLAQSVIPDFMPAMGQQGSARGFAIGMMLVPTLLAGLTSYVGFRLGTKDDGLPAFLGNVVGGLAGIAAVVGLLATFGVATIPLPTMPAPAPKAQEVTSTPGPIITSI